MLDTLLAFFKGSAFENLSTAFSNLQPILSDLEQNYSKDNQDAKNALIDTMCQILQSHKNQ